MKTFLVTGGASGIGAAVKAQLETEGNKVYTLDLKNADFCADLSRPEERKRIVNVINETLSDGIDGLVCCAGVGGACGNPSLIMSVNYYGAVAIVEGCYTLLLKKKGTCVLLASDSIAQGYANMTFVNLALQDESEEQLLQILKQQNKDSMGLCSSVYISSKYALTLWMRRHAASWGARGIRMNCVGPGTTRTPMCQDMGPKAEYALNALPIPMTYNESLMLEPEDIASVICFLLSPASKAIHGILLMADGGTEVAINTEHVY